MAKRCKMHILLLLCQTQILQVLKKSSSLYWQRIRYVFATRRNDRFESCKCHRQADGGLETRSPPIGEARRNAALIYMKISADITCVISGDLASVSEYSPVCQRDPFYTILCSIRQHFAANQKQLLTSYPSSLWVSTCPQGWEISWFSVKPLAMRNSTESRRRLHFRRFFPRLLPTGSDFSSYPMRS